MDIIHVTIAPTVHNTTHFRSGKPKERVGGRENHQRREEGRKRRGERRKKGEREREKKKKKEAAV